MGIHKLMSLILEKAKGAVKDINMEALTGRIIACDASTVVQSNNVGDLPVFDIQHYT